MEKLDLVQLCHRKKIMYGDILFHGSSYLTDKLEPRMAYDWGV